MSRTLYHGTSSLHLDSIEEHGLGGKNIIEELDVVGCLETLHEYALACFQESGISSEHINANSFASSMFKQYKGDRLNFQHGNVYCTTRKEQAKGYAVHGHTYQFGGEIFSYLKIVSKEIEDKDLWKPEFNDFEAIGWLDEVSKTASYPVLITIPEEMLSLSDLMTETGETVKGHPHPDFDCCYRLGRTLDYKDLEVEEITETSMGILRGTS